ncbi:MAG: helicase-related protein [Anaerolineae bacterium]|nr:helicase-related protein [Anaerolineae bacterium]
MLDLMKMPDCDLWHIAEKLSQLGVVSPAHRQPLESHSTVSEYLWDALSGNPHLIDLRQDNATQRTGELDNIAKTLFGENLNPEDRLRALYNIIELGSMARPDGKSAPMLSARYHVFMRPPQGVWVCLNLDCSGKQSHDNEGWSRIFASKRERCDACDALVYPLVVCRDCGQTYIKTSFGSSHYHGESIDDNDVTRYLTWKTPESNHALSNEDEEDEIRTANTSTLTVNTVKICLNCGREDPRNCCETPCITELLLTIEIEQSKTKGQRPKPLNKMNECLRCGTKAIQDTRVVTTISVNGSTPLSILTTELYRRLPAVSDKPGNGRKLLTFYDSRQGAARFAAFLQDIANGQHYDHIIPKVVEEIETNEHYLPNLDSTAQEAIQMGWDERLYHHDEELKSSLSLDRKRPNQNDRKMLGNLWRTIILSEFTTRRKRRQSLEALGVVGVKYFEEETDFDVTELASSLHFSEQQTRILIEFLLDDVRQSKAIKFPEGVNIDDVRFGRNVSNPRIVKSNAQKGEIPWIGKTDRHRRKRYVQKVIKNLGMNYEIRDAEQILSFVWDWLTQSEVFVGTPQHGYQLDFKSIFLSTQLDWCQCQQCQRLYARAAFISCPHPRCDGELRPADVSSIQSRNYFYQNMQRTIIPMRVEEHTAQLDPTKGRHYQDKFRDGDINVLSCSTTFEMGIDLGDLQSVVMSNVPPTVANYRQRSGRAGRRAGGAAFILTWADERPHDQVYFKDPIEIIEGRIKVPYIALENPIIEQRHMNAVLLSAFMRYRKASGYIELSKVAPFFEPTQTDRHYDALASWTNNRSDYIQGILSEFIIPTENYQLQVDSWLRGFEDDMQRIEAEYQKRYEYYTQQIESIIHRMKSDMSSSDLKSLQEKQTESLRLRERMNEDAIISFLSDKGVLPSYSFPLYTVELVLPMKHQTRGLRLQRDLKQAIRGMHRVPKLLQISTFGAAQGYASIVVIWYVLKNIQYVNTATTCESVKLKVNL